MEESTKETNAKKDSIIAIYGIDVKKEKKSAHLTSTEYLNEFDITNASRVFNYPFIFCFFVCVTRFF